MSYKLDSFFGKDSAKAEHTGSIRPVAAPEPSPAGDAP